MKDMIESLFGVYTPVMTDVTYTWVDALGDMQSETVQVVATGLAGVDWPWLMGVLLFAIVLYSLFRILGVFFK